MAKAKKQPLRVVVAAKLKEARTESQAAIAEKMGVSQVNISKIESGLENLTLDTIEAYAKAIGARIEIVVEKKQNTGTSK